MESVPETARQVQIIATASQLHNDVALIPVPTSTKAERSAQFYLRTRALIELMFTNGNEERTLSCLICSL